MNLEDYDVTPGPQYKNVDDKDSLIIECNKAEKALLKRVLKLYRKPSGTLTPEEYRKLGALLEIRGS